MPKHVQRVIGYKHMGTFETNGLKKTSSILQINKQLTDEHA